METSSSSIRKEIALIAGNGGFPLELLKSAKRQNISVYTIALYNEADPQVEQLSTKTIWLHVCQLGKIIKQIKSWKLDTVIFLGGIKRTRFYSFLKTDLRAVKLLAKMRSIRDDEILRAILNEFAIDGIETISPKTLLPDLVVKKGRLTNSGLTSDQLKDAEIGWKVAETIGSLDVGQTVIAKTGTIIAIEAIEGTDQAIIRAGKLCGGGFTVVKLPKPNQDLRIDLPSIGENTLKIMSESGGKALILKTSGAMILDPISVKSLADKYSITIEVFDSLNDILSYKI